MKLAFYKSPKFWSFSTFWNTVTGADAPNYWDWLVNQFSGRGGYSHVEGVFADGMCFSSSPRDGGARFKCISGILDSGKWDLVELSVNDEELIRKWCEQQVGKRYDYSGVLGFVGNIRDDNTEWFCSEIWAAIIQNFCGCPKIEPWRISPNSLRQMALMLKRS